MERKTRTVAEGQQERGINEEYAYSFTLTDKLPAGTYSGAANALYEKDENGDFLTAVAGWNNGDPSVSTTTFTTSKFNGGILENGQTYRLNCAVDVDGDLWDWNVFIIGRL